MKKILALAAFILPIAMTEAQAKDDIDPENTFYAWLGFLFSYHYLLHMGFYNFALSFALFFIVTGYW